MRFTSVQLDGDFAGEAFIDFGVELAQAIDADVGGKEDLRLAWHGGGVGDAVEVEQGGSAQRDRTIFQKRPTQYWPFHFLPLV